MDTQDNNIQATQAANQAVVNNDPNIFGATSKAPTPTTTPPAGLQMPNQPTVANSQTANNIQTGTSTQPTTPPTVNTPTAPTSALQMPLQTAGLQMPTGAAANSTFDPNTGQQVSPSEAAFNQVKASGAAVPDSATQASQTINQAVTQNTPTDNSKQISAISTTLANDPGWQQLLSDAKNIQSVSTQQQSLTTQYNNLLQQYNIPQLDATLVSDQNIINGTEDDIRNEVQAAGGFATNSQVLGLATARNKTLIQNYNNLLQTKNDAMNQITTMMGFAEKDQATAIQVANNQLNIDQQLASYQQKFQDNAKQGYQNVISAVGYSGLMQALQNDPASISLAEQTLGLSPGSLATIASIPDPATQKAAVELEQAKQNLAQSKAEDPLKLQADQANIAQSKASTNASNVSAANSAQDLAFKKANGGLTPAEVQAQQTEIGKAQQTIQNDAADLIGQLASKKVNWQDAYAELKTKYYPSDNSQEAANTIDSLLQANVYRH